MNVFRRIVLGLCWLTVVCGLGACSDKNAAAPTDPDALPEAVAVQKAFASADPSFRNPVKQTLDLVQAGKQNRDAYAEAMPQLQMLAANPQMTAEQRKLLEALLERLKQEISARK